MPKCPHCNAEVNHLDIHEASHLVHLSLDEHGNAMEAREELATEQLVGDYFCPHCGKTIATSEADALSFLRGEEPELCTWTVYLMVPYMTWEDIKARTEGEALDRCHYPWEFDCNEPHYWLAVEEEEDR